jgi:hypothetical protein
MESTTSNGLIVSYDEENCEFTLDWDENTHPEYNFLADLTSDDIVKILEDRLEQLQQEENAIKNSEANPE